MAHRYPNRRPSDFVSGLDEYQAFQLDLSLAMKFKTLEDEKEMKMTKLLLEGMDNIMRSNGATVPKRDEIESIIKNEKDYDDVDFVPLLDDVLNSLGASNMIINVEELPQWQPQ